MSRAASAIMLWLFVINLGVTFGAGIYEHRIVVPRWLQSRGNAAVSWNADAARQDAPCEGSGRSYRLCRLPCSRS